MLFCLGIPFECWSFNRILGVISGSAALLTLLVKSVCGFHTAAVHFNWKWTFPFKRQPLAQTLIVISHCLLPSQTDSCRSWSVCEKTWKYKIKCMVSCVSVYLLCICVFLCVPLCVVVSRVCFCRGSLWYPGLFNWLPRYIFKTIVGEPKDFVVMRFYLPHLHIDRVNGFLTTPLIEYIPVQQVTWQITFTWY